MRLTVLTQTAKGLSETAGEGEDQEPLRSEVLKTLESIKWYLWHGNVFQAFRHLQFVEMSKPLRNSAHTSNAMVVLFRTTASVNVTVRESALTSWNRRSTKW